MTQLLIILKIISEGDWDTPQPKPIKKAVAGGH